jgi:aminoglycoside phosphotransferase (APT) family kinase protein
VRPESCVVSSTQSSCRSANALAQTTQVASTPVAVALGLESSALQRPASVVGALEGEVWGSTRVALP